MLSEPGTHINNTLSALTVIRIRGSLVLGRKETEKEWLRPYHAGRGWRKEHSKCVARFRAAPKSVMEEKAS